MVLVLVALLMALSCVGIVASAGAERLISIPKQALLEEPKKAVGRVGPLSEGSRLDLDVFASLTRSCTLSLEMGWCR